MKKLIIILLCLSSFPAMGQENRDGYTKLPGNAYYRPGTGDNVYIYRRYDTRDDITRRVIGNTFGSERRRIDSIPTNDARTICGGVSGAGDRRRCLNDVRDLNKDRAELWEKYNQ